jgi:predicted RNA binding protein YcfA (HicA-like mRNA interferase family)
VTIPVHAGETIGAGLLKRILVQAETTPEAFREAL